MKKSTRKIVFFSLFVALFMFAFSFALAPLYNHFCKITGINVSLTEKEFFEKADLARRITIQFIATNNENLPWDFYPVTKTVTVHPGENTKIFFYAKNNTKHSMTVQAIPSFTPVLSSRYFRKLECFCFRQQTLAAGAAMEMPVVFHIDKELPNEIHTITLAYTLFDVTPRT